jgi:hypothetical protein
MKEVFFILAHALLAISLIGVVAILARKIFFFFSVPEISFSKIHPLESSKKVKKVFSREWKNVFRRTKERNKLKDDYWDKLLK